MTVLQHSHADQEGCSHSHHEGHVHRSSPLDASALISGRGLTLSRNGRRVLDHVDIDIRANEIVTLIGPNGAGKTTLVRLLLGLERAHDGALVRRSDTRIGYVPQR